jgi:hypothetical protein
MPEQQTGVTLAGRRERLIVLSVLVVLILIRSAVFVSWEGVEGLFPAWIALAAVPHISLLSDYLRHPPPGGKQLIVRSLEAQGIDYATSDYWIAYAVTFMTDETVIADSARHELSRLPRN